MSVDTWVQIGTAVVTICAGLDAIIPPSTNPVLNAIKNVVSFVAMNFGHSRNIAPAREEKSE